MVVVVGDSEFHVIGILYGSLVPFCSGHGHTHPGPEICHVLEHLFPPGFPPWSGCRPELIREHAFDVDHPLFLIVPIIFGIYLGREGRDLVMEGRDLVIEGHDQCFESRERRFETDDHRFDVVGHGPVEVGLELVDSLGNLSSKDVLLLQLLVQLCMTRNGCHGCGHEGD